MPAGRPKEPINLILAKGNAHFTKKQIEERQKSEIKVNFTDINPPEYLTDEQKKEFLRISHILLVTGIMTELDEECLAHYLVANTNYIFYTKQLRTLNNKLSKARSDAKIKEYMAKIDLYLTYQDKALKQCRACGNDLGLSISSRCKLILPPTKEEPKKNKFDKFKRTS